MTAAEAEVNDLAAVLADMTYRPGVKMRTYQSFEPFNQAVLELEVECIDSRGWQLPEPRKLTVVHRTIVPEYATGSTERALAFVRQCLVNLETHELDEWLRYKGDQLRDPHKDGL